MTISTKENAWRAPEGLLAEYMTSFDTAAGTISFENEALFRKDEEGYQLVWDDSLIFPNLISADKKRVFTTQAERGAIPDRTDVFLQEKVPLLRLESFRASWKTERKQSHRLQNCGNNSEIDRKEANGYGQGQVLVNPLHMACIYSGF